MAAEQSPETPHERRVTWALMALVVAFVVVMSGIVLWITSSLVRFERDGAGPGATSATKPSSSGSGRQVFPTATLQPTRPVIQPTPSAPLGVDVTWTPVPGSKGYVKFLYYYVRPTQVTLGQCVQLTWEVANAVSIKLYRDDELLLVNPPPSHTFEDCPARVGYTVYRMVGVNRLGQSNYVQLQVRVKEAP